MKTMKPMNTMKKIAALLPFCLFLSAQALYAKGDKAATLTSLEGKTFVFDTYTYQEADYYDWGYAIGKSGSLLTVYEWNEEAERYEGQDFEYKITGNKIKYGKGLKARKGTIESEDSIKFSDKVWKASDGSLPSAGSVKKYWRLEVSCYTTRQGTKYVRKVITHNVGYNDVYDEEVAVELRDYHKTPFSLYLDGKCIYEGTSPFFPLEQEMTEKVITTKLPVRLEWGKTYELRWQSPSQPGSKEWVTDDVTNKGRITVTKNLD